MRAISVVGASLALIGCCLFVMHSESVESVKLGKLPPALAALAAKAGDRAKGPAIHASPEIGGGSADAVVPEHADKAVLGVHAKNPEGWAKPKTRLQSNCVALKAYAYTVEDEAIDLGSKDLGITYDLLRAMTPTADPKKTNLTPEDCVKEFDAFAEATAKKYPLEDSIPHKELKSIKAAMKGKGLLITMKEDNKKIISIDGVKLGFSSHRVISNLKGMDPMQSEVLHMLSTMKGTFDKHVVATAVSGEVEADAGLDKADSEELEHWDGDLA